MSKAGMLLLASTVSVLALIVPFSLSLYLAQSQGRDEALASLHGLADDVLNRAENARMQINDAIDALSNHANDAECSPGQLDRMDRLSASFSHVAGMARLQGSTLMCHTLGKPDLPVNLGRPAGPPQDGMLMWNRIELPGLPGQFFHVLGRNGYAAVIYSGLAIDLLNRKSPVSLALFSPTQGGILGRRGEVRDEWIDRFQGSAITFKDQDHFVVIQPSEDGSYAALASMPASLAHTKVTRLAYILGPVGLALGLLLTGMVIHITRRRMSLAGELQAAIDRDEFFVQYQPIVDISSGRCVGAEALARWRNGEGKLISPNVFIPLAEANGMIQRITGRVMEIVARDAAALLKANPHLHIAINLSAEDLHAENLHMRLKDLVVQAGMGPNSLMFEVTERGLMAPDKARGALLALRAEGFQVAIDDFGTGHSSLSYLATYELDFLKIDKMFVDTLNTDSPTSLVTFHIIELARSLGLKMIAEGVETEEQRDILRQRGVQYAQGWLFAKPMSIEKLTEFACRQVDVPVDA